MMKTLKITLVAAIAATLAWQLGIPQRISPAHPILTNFFLTLIITIVVQFAWSNAKRSNSKKAS